MRATQRAATAPGGDDTEDLRHFYRLTPDDLALVETVCGDGHGLALALTLVWARAERVMVADATTLPAPVIAFVATQLDLTLAALDGYHPSPTTRASDAAAIREHLGLRPFGQDDAARLRAHLHEKVANTGNTAALLDAAEDWLLHEGLLRPAGETTIERLMYAARAEAEEALFTALASRLLPEQGTALDELCRTDGHESLLAALGTPPRVPSAPAIAAECRRLEVIRSVTPTPFEWGPVTANRRCQWAAVARRGTAQALRAYPPAKRRTLLLAFLTVRAEETTDALVEMFDALIGRVFSHSEAELTEAKLDQAQARLEGARLFRTVAEVLLDPEIPPAAVRDEVFRRVPRERVSAAVARDLALERGEAEAYLAQVDTHVRHLRAFGPPLLATLRFGSPRAGNELLEALEALAAMNVEHRLHVPPTAPVGFIPKRWARAIVRPEGVDRHGWEAALLHETRAALRAGDLTVVGSRRYTPWDTDLYTPAAWEGRRASWLEERGRAEDGTASVQQALDGLHTLTSDVAQRLPRNADARIERGKLSLSALERVEEPPSVDATRAALTGLIEPIDLPALLMEVDRRTGFMAALTHLTGRRPPSPEHLAEVVPPSSPCWSPRPPTWG